MTNPLVMGKNSHSKFQYRDKIQKTSPDIGVSKFWENGPSELKNLNPSVILYKNLKKNVYSKF